MTARLTAVQRFAFALVLIALTVVIVTIFALRQPWIGLDLAAEADGSRIGVRHVDPAGPSAAVTPGAGLTAIAGAKGEIALSQRDLIEEPDALESYAAFNAFMARQQAIAEILAEQNVLLRVVGAEGYEADVPVSPASSRPLSSLPFVYWFQIGCAVIIAVIGSWVASLRRGDRPARHFALAGYGASTSIFSAAIYSTRELALPSTLFETLSALNHAGAMLFAAFMIGLFTQYPKRLGVNVLCQGSAVFLAVWWFLNTVQALPDIGSGFYLGVLLAMLTIVSLIGMQYFATGGDLPSRRALAWLGISVLIGAGAFSVLMALPILLRYEAAIPQAYSFGFFPLIYLGVALGLVRYRLFDLDRWAFGILGYVTAVVLFVVIDVALISAFALNFQTSLGLTALIVGLIYLPVRNIVTDRVLAARRADPYDLFRSSADVALQPTPSDREARWQTALEGFFRPLSVENDFEAPVARPVVEEEGVALGIPAYPWSAALRLRHLDGGRRLFGEPHVRMVEQLAHLVAEAERSRQSYDLGVREERRRIGRDLHDNVGAMLLSSLRARDAGASRGLVRDALSDIREIVNGLSDRAEPLSHVVAHLRAETMERLEGIAVDWPLGDADRCADPLPYAVYRSFTSAHRELVSNILRHASASRVAISTAVRDGTLRHRVENDGVAPTAVVRERGGGNGLANLSQRAADLGGRFTFTPAGDRAIADIDLPLGGILPSIQGGRGP